MKYVGLEVTPQQNAGVCEQYYEDLFADRQADFAFPTEDVVVLADALSLIFNPGITIFLIFAWPESPWELNKIKQLTGRNMYEPLCSCHLTNFRGLSAYVHFSVHPEFAPLKKEVIEAGKDFLPWLFAQERRDEPGVPFVTTLIGLTPRYNLGSLGFAHAVGFERAAIIKDGMYSRIKERYCDAVLLTLKKDVYV